MTDTKKYAMIFRAAAVGLASKCTEMYWINSAVDELNANGFIDVGDKKIKTLDEYKTWHMKYGPKNSRFDDNTYNMFYAYDSIACMFEKLLEVEENDN